jgi:hypothetical protein
MRNESLSEVEPTRREGDSAESIEIRCSRTAQCTRDESLVRICSTGGRCRLFDSEFLGSVPRRRSSEFLGVPRREGVRISRGRGSLRILLCRSPSSLSSRPSSLRNAAKLHPLRGTPRNASEERPRGTPPRNFASRFLCPETDTERRLPGAFRLLRRSLHFGVRIDIQSRSGVCKRIRFSSLASRQGLAGRMLKLIYSVASPLR